MEVCPDTHSVGWGLLENNPWALKGWEYSWWDRSTVHWLSSIRTNNNSLQYCTCTPISWSMKVIDDFNHVSIIFLIYPGLHECAWRLRPLGYHQDLQCIPWSLLYCTPKYSHRRFSWCPWHCTWKIPPLLWDLLSKWCTCTRVLTSLPTFIEILLLQHWEIWSAKQSLFVNHWVKTYHSCQEALVSIKPIWSTQINAYNQHTKWQTGHCMSQFHILRHAAGYLFTWFSYYFTYDIG